MIFYYKQLKDKYVLLQRKAQLDHEGILFILGRKLVHRRLLNDWMGCIIYSEAVHNIESKLNSVGKSIGKPWLCHEKLKLYSHSYQVLIFPRLPRLFHLSYWFILHESWLKPWKETLFLGHFIMNDLGITLAKTNEDFIMQCYRKSSIIPKL